MDNLFQRTTGASGRVARPVADGLWVANGHRADGASFVWYPETFSDGRLLGEQAEETAAEPLLVVQ
ncbi:MAG: hypothetical protein MK191_08090 [Acidimicrobiales bacterium]|nr:hypothetical protein [Acidimicrobiales bacterium]